jgi:hypothetical protein
VRPVQAAEPCPGRCHVGLVSAWPSGLAKEDTNLGCTGTNGVVDVFAQGGRGAVVAHVPKGLHEGLREKERHGRRLLEHASEYSSTATRCIGGPIRRERLRFVAALGLGEGPDLFRSILGNV